MKKKEKEKNGIKRIFAEEYIKQYDPINNSQDVALKKLQMKYDELIKNIIKWSRNLTG